MLGKNDTIVFIKKDTKALLKKHKKQMTYDEFIKQVLRDAGIIQ